MHKINSNLTEKQTSFFSSIFSPDGKMREDNDNTEFVFFGGFGCGKSYSTMLCTLLPCLIYPGTHWLYARATYQQLKDSVIPQFLKAFPPEEIGYRYVKTDREIVFHNKSKIVFRAYDKDVKILSNMYHGVSYCQAEEIPYELFLQTRGRNRLRDNGIPKNIFIVEGNPADGWVKQRYKDKKLPEKVYYQEATTFDNPYLSAEYISDMIRNYPEAMVRRYVYGEWGSFDERVFSEFNDKIHVVSPFELKHDWMRCIGMDYGWIAPSAMVWVAVDYMGNLIFFDEFYENRKTPDELAIESRRHGVCPVVIDYSTKRPDRDGRSTWIELSEKGVPLIESNKDKFTNIVRANTSFKTNRIFIFKNCINLIREVREYKWKRVRQSQRNTIILNESNGTMQNTDLYLTEETQDGNDHAIDAFLYVMAHLSNSKSEMEVVGKNTFMASVLLGNRKRDINKEA